jgi:hypothetical protein
MLGIVASRLLDEFEKNSPTSDQFVPCELKLDEQVKIWRFGKSFAEIAKPGKRVKA